MIRVESLTKRYGDKVAVEDLSFISAAAIVWSAIRRRMPRVPSAGSVATSSSVL